jgi:hypothetical protein
MGEFAKDVEKILDDHAERRRSRSQIDQGHTERTRIFREEFLRLRGAIIQPAMAEAARSLSEKGQEASVTMEQSEVKGLVKHPGDLVALIVKGRGPLGRQVLCYQCVTGTTDRIRIWERGVRLQDQTSRDLERTASLDVVSNRETVQTEILGFLKLAFAD